MPESAACSLAILSALVLATGIGARPYAHFIRRLAAGSTAAPAVELPALFTAGALADSALVAALGVGVYLVVMTPLGARVAHRVRRVAPRLRTVLVFFVAGLALFATAAWW